MWIVWWQGIVPGIQINLVSNSQQGKYNQIELAQNSFYQPNKIIKLLFSSKILQ